jgi:hypothetical protein
MGERLYVRGLFNDTPKATDYTYYIMEPKRCTQKVHLVGTTI